MSSKVKDGLFLGDIDAAQDAEFLQLNGIEHIINCVPRQVPNLFQQSLGLDYTACELDEVLKRPFFDLKNRQFMSIVQLIDRALEKTESVLVHSLTGVNRSPSVMMGYLMVKYCWGVDKAYEFLLTKRADIKPHESYIDQLCLLEGQLQGHFGSRATEQQLYEWHPALADPRTDEIVLVHTYLNTPSTASNKPPVKKEPPKSPSARRLSWIDHVPQMKKLYPSLMIKPERPPNHSYSDMVPANGWVDLLTSANPSTSTARGSEPLPRPIAAFMEAPVPAEATNDHDELDDDDAVSSNSRQRVHSFSVPRRREIEVDHTLSPTSTASDRDDADLMIDVTPPAASKQTAAPRYQQQQQIRGNTLTAARPTRQPQSTQPQVAPAPRSLAPRSNLPSAMSATSISSSVPASAVRFASSSFRGTPASGGVTSTVMSSSLNKTQTTTAKTPEYAKPAKPVTRGTTPPAAKPTTTTTKQGLERRASAGTSNGSFSARGTYTGDLPLPQTTSAFTIRRSVIDTDPWSASFPSSTTPSSSTRPRTAPPRLRKDVPSSSTTKTSTVNRVNLDVWTLPSSGSGRRLTDTTARTPKPTTSKTTAAPSASTASTSAAAARPRPTRAQWK